MMTSALICCNCSSLTAVQSMFSTLTGGVVRFDRPFSRTLLVSLCRTPGWQSLKTYRLGLQEQQMVMPVKPTPLPSSRTVLHTGRFENWVESG